MKNFYLNENCKLCNNPAESDCIYTICNDTSLLLKDFNKYDIEDCGIDLGETNLVVYRWSIHDVEWIKLNSKQTEEILSTFYSQYPELCPNNVDEITCKSEQKWNWKVECKSGLIQMNDEPVSLNEIVENFEIIQKPSFFGKSINRIIIERA